MAKKKRTRGVPKGSHQIPVEFRARVARRMQIVMNPYIKAFATNQEAYAVFAKDINDLHPNTVRNWHDGMNLPTLMNLVRFADYFEVSIDYLLGRTAVKELAHTIKEVQRAVA